MFVLEKIKEYAKTGRAALINREETLRFTQLDAWSEAFGAWLLDQFGDDRAPVVIYGHKETGFLPCVFGALKSGRGYVPIDRAIPLERAMQIIREVSPRLIVNFTGLELDAKAKVLTPDALCAILDGAPAVEIPRSVWISGDTPAYILFTSGSTGTPKGVPITVNNLTNFYHGLLPYLGMEGHGVILNQISYSFDVSGCSIYVGLSLGMTLFSIDSKMAENIGILLSWLRQSNLATWVSTPSFAQLCVQSKMFTEKLLPSLRQFLFCGETLTHTLCDQLAERFPKARIYNTYGPTEATVLVTAAEVTKAMREDNRSIPIGKPIEGAVLRLEDSAGNEITMDDEKGELLILGGSVSPGYFARPDLSEKPFFTDAAANLRGYRTGDLCYRKDGLYYYCGRMDNQIKLNGFRVEIEDVERNLEKLPNIVRAAVLPVRDGDKVQYLAAFLLLGQPDGLSGFGRAIQTKRRLAAYLPAYMIPRKICVTEGFPLNANGKVDKKALALRLEGM